MPLPDIMAADQIHLHLVDETQISPDVLLDHYRAVMTDDERERSNRFHFDRDRRQFTISRALLRFTLSSYVLGVAPADWRFSRNQYGRPAIENAIDAPLDFNLSHTTGCAVLAVSRLPCVGVDVEWLGRQLDALDLARRFFAYAEVAALPNDPAGRDRQFFQLWTLKEAFVKARGKGLVLPLDSFCIGFPTRDTISLRISDQPGERWRLWTLAAAPDHALSVAAMTAEPLKLRLFNSVPGVSSTEAAPHILRRL
ncbi:MAG: 4'-phosphopantetheinyl transferase superfamily protein [Rhizobiaceae bacterium]